MLGRNRGKTLKLRGRTVFSHSKLMVLDLSTSGKHSLTGPTVAVCMLVMVQNSTKDGDEQFRQKNNMRTRKKEKLAGINI